MVTVMACQSIAQTATKSVYGAPVSNYVAILPSSPYAWCMQCIVVYKALGSRRGQQWMFLITRGYTVIAFSFIDGRFWRLQVWLYKLINYCHV